MKITLIVAGKTPETTLSKIIDDYTKRINHYIAFDIINVGEAKNTKNLTMEQQKYAEAQLIQKRLEPSDYIILLDERGKEYTSIEFSSMIEKKMHTVGKRLVFIIGGAYGFDQSIYDLANEKMSLSKLTFPHMLIRLFFVEQIYRAMTIMRGDPYHHE